MNLLQGLYNIVAGLVGHAGTFAWHLTIHVLTKLSVYLIYTLFALVAIIPCFGYIATTGAVAVGLVASILAGITTASVLYPFYICMAICGVGQCLIVMASALCAKMVLKATVLFK